MDSFSENSQDFPPTTTSSSQAAIQQSTGSKFSSPVACSMILCLHFLGCDIETIFWVLGSYDLGGTISDVASHIEEEQLPRHDEFDAPPDGRITYARSTGTTLTIDYAQGEPMQIMISGPNFSKFSLPRPSVVVITSDDGRKIVTRVAEGYLQCSSGEPTF